MLKLYQFVRFVSNAKICVSHYKGQLLYQPSFSHNPHNTRQRTIKKVFTSMMFLFVRDSWGSLYSVYLRRTLSMSVLAYWYSLLLELKMIRAISQSHSTDNS